MRLRASSSTGTGLKAMVVASAACWLLAVLLAASAASLAAAAAAAAVPAPPPPPARKILRRAMRMDEGCAGAEDIAIYQAHASSLPSGVPAYKVDVTNQCGLGGGGGDLDDCAIAGIHVRCGWFSSVSLVDPAKFRRLDHDDCLLNDGRPLLAGDTVSFEYANSFPYDLSVRIATCVVVVDTTSPRAVNGSTRHEYI